MGSESDALSIVYGLKLERPFQETLWNRRERRFWSRSTMAFAQLRTTNSLWSYPTFLSHILSWFGLSPITCTNYRSWSLKTRRDVSYIVCYQVMHFSSDVLSWLNEWIGSIFFVRHKQLEYESTGFQVVTWTYLNILQKGHSQLLPIPSLHW